MSISRYLNHYLLKQTFYLTFSDVGIGVFPYYFSLEIQCSCQLSINVILLNYLQTRPQGGSSFLTELKQRLLLSPSEAAAAGTRYNVPLINSLVLYVGMQVFYSFFYFSGFRFIFFRSLRLWGKKIRMAENISSGIYLILVALQLGHPTTAVKGTSCTGDSKHCSDVCVLG